MFHVPEKFRVKSGQFATTEMDGNNGLFLVTLGHSQKVRVIASDGMMWEHVSVSRGDRCPTWEEMCQIKDMFWSEEDCVIQFHPPRSEYINNHPYCLHLWRQSGENQETPPTYMVGMKC